MQMDVIESTLADLEKICSAGLVAQDKMTMVPQSFEKDDDGNGHIDFITSASVGG